MSLASTTASTKAGSAGTAPSSISTERPWTSDQARSAESEEDDGWLIGLVVDLPRERTELQIIDARAFASEPVARIHVPHRVPPGFHGNWLPERP